MDFHALLKKDVNIIDTFKFKNQKVNSKSFKIKIN